MLARPNLPSSPSTDRIVSGSTRNPISLRVYKALSSSFQDSSSRDALETLSALYAPSSLPVPQITLQAQDDDSDFEGDNSETTPARKWLDLKPGDPTIAENARRNLRRDVELQLAESSSKFLHAFGEVDNKLNALQEHMEAMRSRCDEAQAELQRTNDACKYLLEKAGGLRAQRQTTATRQAVVSLFLSRFTLTQAESEAIASHDVPVGKQLFAAMDRAESIREDCHVLLSAEGSEGGGTKAGLDIMARTANQLDVAYAKVQRWCSYEFRQLGKDSHLEVSPVMREAIRRLQKRLDILSGALSDLAAVRQTTLLTSFITALTRGGPSGLPRPIELHAHDPIRYVGDMLAWVHQAMATEREFLDSLFGLSGEKRMVGSVWRNDQQSEEAGWVRDLMDRDLEKICMPLRVRVQQTIKSQEGSITAYKIANLLQFYLLTMRRTIGEEALLSKTLEAMTDVANQVFFDTVEAQGRSLLRFLHPPDPDLSPPLALRDVSQVLREIMTVYDSSLLEGEVLDDNKEKDAIGGKGFSRVLDAAVGPALEMCRRMGDMKKETSTWDKGIFLVNCIVHFQTVFQPFTFATPWVERLDAEIDKYVEELVNEHTPLSRIPEASSSSITAALEKFDGFLSTLDVLTSPRLSLISSARLSSRIHRTTLRRIGEAYGTVTVLGSRRPFGQMSVLWQVLGVGEGSNSGPTY
ncbi:hypothetical protein BS47DRAFT_1351988 [Hydnum rufescens UP504]|uniref:Conserved oligomeric Golgi complex subunit 6 n=1 Tax=Hydnum rufescens UP504 TaxID=1448309 RepID=A0A9P6DLQ3_9AGAM|nr:hypothetical protein BS47DRAFT_1351988 [Hydnum rufescens UP504]